jgi:hypothetical protein
VPEAPERDQQLVGGVIAEDPSFDADRTFRRKEQNMKRVSILVIGIGVVVTLGLLTVEGGSARGEKATCNLATLKGRYLFATYGTLLPPAFGLKEPTPGASAGFHIFNGDGTGTDIVTVRIGGKIVLKKVAAPISYTVNADCTGSYTVRVPDGPSFDLFVAPQGEAVALIATAPEGNYVSSIDERVEKRG